MRNRYRYESSRYGRAPRRLEEDYYARPTHFEPLGDRDEFFGEYHSTQPPRRETRYDSDPRDYDRPREHRGMMQRIRDWAHRDPNTPPGYRGPDREGAHDWSTSGGDYGRDLDLSYESRMRNDYRNDPYADPRLRDRDYEMSRNREYDMSRDRDYDMSRNRDFGYGGPRYYGRSQFDRALDPYEQRRYERERALYDSENDREWRRR
jgi:hypothetical protein